MKKILSRKFAAGFISICGMAAGIAIACSGDFGEEYGVSNFTPEVFVKSSYSPFFYSDAFYYKIGHDEIQNTRFNSSNVADWSVWMNHAIPEKELVYFLQKASLSTIDSISLWINGRQSAWPPYLKGFVSEKKRLNKKLVEFFNYLRLAKISEEFAVNEIPEPWEYD